MVVLCSGVALAGLGERRIYEQVSPEFKAGYPVFGRKHLSALASDGESAEFASVGAFDGSGESFAFNPYVSTRGGSDWATTGLFPPPLDSQCWQGFEEFSADLSRFEFVVDPGSSAVACNKSATNTVWVRQPDGSFVRASPAMTTATGVSNQTDVVGASANLSHVIISREDPPPAQIVPDETVAGSELFEADASSLRIVANNNEGEQLTRYCDVLLGSESGDAFDAVSQPDASEVFFSLPVNTRSGGTEACGNAIGHPEELFVRLGGEKTIEISRPLLEKGEECSEVPCPEATSRAPAVFQGASEDGSKVFFTTAQPLTGNNEDNSNNLYVAEINCSVGLVGECSPAQKSITSLVQISRDPSPGQAAEVESHIVAMSPDGSRVYFVARGLLSTNENGQKEVAISGAENLYVYNDVNHVTDVAFVADLCSGPERSGGIDDSRCPSTLSESNTSPVNDRRLWSKTESREAQTTPNGAFLVFATYGRLIESGPEADTDSAKDIYRYDVETGGLRRVSVGEAGFDSNGNSSLFDATISGTEFRGSLQEEYELGTRAMTTDGSKVVFMTSEPLSVDAINGEQDIYIWNEGRVGMISSGTATEPDEEPVISESGRDVLFLTSTGLVPSDTDGVGDLYDARINGGFTPSGVAPEECAGDACQGPLSPPEPLIVPGSSNQPAGANLAAPTVVKKVKSRPKARVVKKKKVKAKAKRSLRVHKKARRAIGEGRGR